MPQPKKVIRTRFLRVGIPEDVLAKVDMELYSELEGRVPLGSYQKLITPMLEEWLQERATGKAISDFKERNSL